MPARSGLQRTRGQGPWIARRRPRDPSSTPESRPCADPARTARRRGPAARCAAQQSFGHATDATGSEWLRAQCGGQNVTGAKSLAALDPAGFGLDDACKQLEGSTYVMAEEARRIVS